MTVQSSPNHTQPHGSPANGQNKFNIRPLSHDTTAQASVSEALSDARGNAGILFDSAKEHVFRKINSFKITKAEILWLAEPHETKAVKSFSSRFITSRPPLKAARSQFRGRAEMC